MEPQTSHTAQHRASHGETVGQVEAGLPLDETLPGGYHGSMRLTAAALALALTASCAATRAATGALEADVLELKALVAQLDRAYADGDSVLAAKLEAEIEVAAAEARESAAALKVAVEDDLQAAKDGILGLSQGGTQGGLIGLALTGAAWFLRDRRKKLGRDPVQVAELERKANGST